MLKYIFLRCAVNSVIKRRQLFKCTRCGYEVYLQAWKAECPSCGSGFTLAPVAGDEEKTRSRMIGYIPPIFSAAYLALTLFIPKMTLAPLLPWPTTQTVVLAITILSLTSSTLSNLLSIVAGAIITSLHMLLVAPSNPAEIGVALLPLGLSASALINELSIRRVIWKAV